MEKPAWVCAGEEGKAAGASTVAVAIAVVMVGSSARTLPRGAGKGMVVLLASRLLKNARSQPARSFQ
jgi:hypothetical protein